MFANTVANTMFAKTVPAWVLGKLNMTGLGYSKRQPTQACDSLLNAARVFGTQGRLLEGGGSSTEEAEMTEGRCISSKVV
jgi:hypothetical protein